MRSLPAHGTLLIASLLSCFLAHAGAPSEVNRAATGGDTLAVVGHSVIRTEEFARRYREKVIRLGITDNGESRRGYLRNLVDDAMVIAEAKREKLDQTKEAVAERARIRLQELLNAYSDKHISAPLAVNDEDLRELFLKMNTKLKVRHLYARTKAGADSLEDALLKGASFEDLALRTFQDPQLRENGGSLGYISCDEMDPAFERTAYAMHVGEVSKPVKTVEGYSVLRVDDRIENPLVTESEFLKAREGLLRFARKRKYEEAVTRHAAVLRATLRIRFNDDALARLWTLAGQGSLQRLTENGSSGISGEALNGTAATWTTGRWSTRRLIRALGATTGKQQAWIGSRENLEDYCAGLIIRGYIARCAEKERLDTTVSFREGVPWLFDTYLMTTLEARLKKRITFTQDSLRAYYEHNSDKFRTDGTIRLSAILLDRVPLADSVRRSLEEGVPFEFLARQYSIQDVTAAKGGDLGFYRKEDLGSLGTDLFGLAEGEWKGPLAGEGNHLFVKCTERKGGVQRSFGESAQEIHDVLVAQSWSAARRQFVESCKNRIRCLVFPDKLMALSLH